MARRKRGGDDGARWWPDGEGEAGSRTESVSPDPARAPAPIAVQVTRVPELFLAWKSAIEEVERRRVDWQGREIFDSVQGAAIAAGEVPRAWPEFEGHSRAIRACESARFTLECELRKYAGTKFTISGDTVCLVRESLDNRTWDRMVVEWST